MDVCKRKRSGKWLIAVLAVAVVAIMVPTIVFAQGTDDSSESGIVTEIYGSANGWDNNAAWVGFALNETLDLSDEDADVKISYEYIEDGEIKTVTSTSTGSVYQKNKLWDGYLTDINNVKYSALDENKVLPADTIIQSNLSPSSKAGLDVTAKIQSGDVTQVRTVVEVTDADGVTTVAKSNWVTYSTDLDYSAPKGISKEVVVAYEEANPGIRFDAAAVIGEREFVTFADALEAAQENDTILLKNGTHNGNVTIDKSIKIQGESKEGTIIVGTETSGNIIAATANIELENLTIDGKKSDLTPKHIQGHGIYAEKGLKVNNVDVVNIGCSAELPLCGCQTGIGIYVNNPAGNPNSEDVAIQNVNISNFQKGAIVVKTTGDVLIENAVITGAGDTDKTAQNGIQINDTQNAVINNAQITGINYTENVNACGVLLVNGAKAEVNDCTFENVKENVSCYDDEAAATVKEGDTVTVITTAHQAVMTPAKEATCTGSGNYAYWYCADCDTYFSDEALTQETTPEEMVIAPKGHGATEVVNAKEATCTQEGYTGDTICSVCKTVLEEGEVIPKTEHNFVNGVCTACGTEEGGTVVPPQEEGDFSTALLAVIAVVLLGGAVAVAVYAKKAKAGR